MTHLDGIDQTTFRSGLGCISQSRLLAVGSSKMYVKAMWEQGQTNRNSVVCTVKQHVLASYIFLCISLSFSQLNSFTHGTSFRITVYGSVGMNGFITTDTIHVLPKRTCLSPCLTLSYIQLILMIVIRQAIWKSKRNACEADLEPTVLIIGGYNKIWILDLELCNTVRYHVWSLNIFRKFARLI